MSPGTKLVLCVVDSLRTDMLMRAAASGSAPTFARLLERGQLIGDCVSAFPSVTPVCLSEITTGARSDRHHISGMNWYHRVERRYVEYGSSFEATRTFGMLRTLYDTVYNMNMSHLSHEVTTIYEELGDAGIRTACTPFLIYRGRRRHELGLEGVLRRVAVAANFRHAVWGPDELFYGELYASRRVPCKPTLARPGTRDEYTACVSRELVEKDLYDFLLFSLPDNDHFSHSHGPEATEESIAHADSALAELVTAAGGLDAFLLDHAVIVMADHAQTDVDRELPLAEILGRDWEVLQPNSEQPELAELAVSPISRAAAIYVLGGSGSERARRHRAVRAKLDGLYGVDLQAWLEEAEGAPAARSGAEPPRGDGLRAVVRRAGAELRFAPGNELTDRRGASWAIEGDLDVLEGERANGSVTTDAYPDAFGRLWSALNAPHAGDILISCAAGYECLDWGAASHVPGGSHGALAAGDSLAPLLLVGFGDDVPERREQWALADVKELVLEHFGLAAAVPG